VSGKVLVISALSLCIAFASGPASYCAFEVKVSKPSGLPLPNVPVAVIQKHESVFAQTTTDATGVARLCDAPLEVVDIHVGADICGSVLVRNLVPTWPERRLVYVTYVESPCDHFLITPRCRILLRIRDEDGRAISGALFEGGGGDGQETSDVFGRLFRSIKRPGKLNGVVTKEGTEPARITAECDSELMVVLRERQ
jgi:hypothetical protein